MCDENIFNLYFLSFDLLLSLSLSLICSGHHSRHRGYWFKISLFIFRSISIFWKWFFIVFVCVHSHSSIFNNTLIFMVKRCIWENGWNCDFFGHEKKELTNICINLLNKPKYSSTNRSLIFDDIPQKSRKPISTNRSRSLTSRKKTTRTHFIRDWHCISIIFLRLSLLFVYKNCNEDTNYFWNLWQFH